MADPLEMYLKGMALQKEKKHREAILAFEQSLEIDPGYFNGCHNGGLIPMRMGRYRDVENVFHSCPHPQPNSSRTLNARKYVRKMTNPQESENENKCSFRALFQKFRKSGPVKSFLGLLISFFSEAA